MPDLTSFRVVAIRQNVILEGQPVLTAARALRWLAHCILRRPATVSIGSGGPRMRLMPRLRGYGSTALFMGREHYERELRFLVNFARSGDVVLDVGANFGIYSLMLARAVAPTGIVHAFEPGAESLAQLRVNIQLNPGLRIVVHDTALSDREGVGSLKHIGGPHTYSLSGDVPGEPVQLTTLDQWVSKDGIERVDIVKVDVEGHEPAFLAGAVETIRRLRPAIMYEVSHSALARGGFSAGATHAALLDLDYQIFKVDEPGVTITGNEEGNFLALPQGSDWLDRFNRADLLTKRT